ncbi:hypothetical protein [Actinomadura sp. HBU206391]|uniref:hypothetical protein n=1 Tax=Actinomadura sp. HBU206391 TaxID=2731692 RepID=UPI00164F9053|nr:hypothetical protein [Actinomadura sp. HBU206391]MBC6459189.1 hypothetical protein [Actinomadura sp. HBU206391]
MQAISVRQPWAWAIARGHKTLSNQSLPTVYRGPLLIHASMRVDLKAGDSPLMHTAGWDPGDPLATLGAAIALAELDDVCTASVRGMARGAAGRSAGNGGAEIGGADGGGDGDVRCSCGAWAEPGAYHWRLSNVHALPRPVVALGRPGLWQPPSALVADVETMLETAGLNR